MMVEYTHLPAVVYGYMLPTHFNVELDATELQALTAATSVYSKVL
jgi:ribosomal protein L25 (general stress protein Ctc)